MKKLLFLIVVIIAILAFAFMANQGAIPAMRTEKQDLRVQTARFFECIKFKEFGQAANFHNEVDRKKADIPKMLEDLFKVPPENIDIKEINILSAEKDSTGELARVKVQLFAKILNTNEEREANAIIYWKKEGDKWVMKLSSSLNKIQRFN